MTKNELRYQKRHNEECRPVYKIITRSENNSFEIDQEVIDRMRKKAQRKDPDTHYSDEELKEIARRYIEKKIEPKINGKNKKTKQPINGIESKVLDKPIIQQPESYKGIENLEAIKELDNFAGSLSKENREGFYRLSKDIAKRHFDTGKKYGLDYLQGRAYSPLTNNQYHELKYTREIKDFRRKLKQTDREFFDTMISGLEASCFITGRNYQEFLILGRKGSSDFMSVSYNNKRLYEKLSGYLDQKIMENR